MVLIKLVAILAFVIVGLHWIHPPTTRRSRPTAGAVCSRALHHLLHLHRLRLRLDRQRGVPRRQKTVPTGIIATLIICTILYVAVALVLTASCPGSPSSATPPPSSTPSSASRSRPTPPRCTTRASSCSSAHHRHDLFDPRLQLGQARVWFAMSRDKLLPDVFSQVHPKFRTPAFATWVAGILVAIPAGLSTWEPSPSSPTSARCSPSSS